MNMSKQRDNENIENTNPQKLVETCIKQEKELMVQSQLINYLKNKYVRDITLIQSKYKNAKKQLTRNIGKDPDPSTISRTENGIVAMEYGALLSEKALDRAELDRLRKGYEYKCAEVTAASEGTETLMNENISLLMDVDRLNAAIVSMENINSLQQQKLEGITAKYQEVKEDLNSKNILLQESNSIRDRHIRDLHETKTKLENAQNDIKALQKKSKDQEDVLCSLVMKNKSLMQDIESCNEKYVLEQNRLKDAHQFAIREKDQEIATLQTKLQESEKRVLKRNKEILQYKDASNELLKAMGTAKFNNSPVAYQDICNAYQQLMAKYSQLANMIKSNSTAADKSSHIFNTDQLENIYDIEKRPQTSSKYTQYKTTPVAHKNTNAKSEHHRNTDFNFLLDKSTSTNLSTTNINSRHIGEFLDHMKSKLLSIGIPPTPNNDKYEGSPSQDTSSLDISVIRPLDGKENPDPLQFFEDPIVYPFNPDASF